VLAFGQRSLLNEAYPQLRKAFPESTVTACSTSGEISNQQVLDDSLVVNALWLDKVRLASQSVNIKDYANSYQAGEELLKKFDRAELSFVFVLSDGQLVNGTDLVKGMSAAVENKIPIAGGLAGDGAAFKHTVVGLNDHHGEGLVVAIGFYGPELKVGYGSRGGWSSFGPTRTITRSEANVLYEIDGKPALELYKRYLGDYAADLPGSALLFPLALRNPEDEQEVVRTILSIDQKRESMTFAGNMPEGATVRLMKANLDHLVDAAFDAAEHSLPQEKAKGEQLSILISCVGRKLIFGSRIDEELESARDILGQDTLITGFYSYGEISPFQPLSSCSLHNQTMTVTTLSEG